MATVYVQNKDGKPLMPTQRCGHVRILLKHGRAKVVRRKPFTIRLTYETPDIVQDLYGGTDPGRTNIGNAVLDEEGKSLYRDVVETRNKDIPALMQERRQHRQASRRGERLRRKRRAKKNGTLSTKLTNGRHIPGTEEVTPVKDIINTEARFMNRKKKQALTPTARHLVDTHLHQIDRIREMLPVKGWSLEMNRFAFMLMEDGSVKGADYQNGRMRAYDSVDSYVYAMQGGECAVCGKQIDHIHHILPRSKGGSDLPENKVGLCDGCHGKVHRGELSLKTIGERKRYGALSVLNQAIPYIYEGLVERFGEENVHIVSGYQTKEIREETGLSKDHDMDAVCIASMMTGRLPKKPEEERFTVKQFRRNDRSLINAQTERTYRLDGKVVARNRKSRYEQKGRSLDQWYEEKKRELGKAKADAMLSRLEVRKSYRRYNDPNRVMPGAVIRFNGITGVLTGQQNNGYYYMMDRMPGVRLKASECRTLLHNKGLVYM